MSPAQKHWRWLLLAGVAMVSIYLAFWWMYHNGPHSHSRLERELFVWPACIGLLLSYLLGLAALQQNKLDKRTLLFLIIGGVIVGLISWAVPPFHSTDVYGYINRGWQQFAYGTNPYVTTISQLPNWQVDPMLTDHWVNNPCPYGFVFARFANWFVQPFKGDIAATLQLFKGLNLLWLWGMTTIVGWAAVQWQQTNNPADSTGILGRRIYLMAWNPIILIHHISNGHNDLWMGGLLAIAVAISLISGKQLVKWPLASVAWVASVLTKYATAVIGPFICWYWLQQRYWGRLVVSLIAMAIAVYLFGLPYWETLASAQFSKLAGNATLPHSSIHAMLVFSGNALFKLFGVRDQLGDPWLTMTRYALTGGFLLSVLWLLRWQGKLLSSKRTWQAALWALCVFVGLVSSKFYPWYLGMVLPAVVILPGRHPLVKLTIIVGLAQLFGITVLGQARMADALIMLVLPIVLYLKRDCIILPKPLNQWLSGLRLSQKA
jgi:ABC-type multidrug transport system fused ATPase/permease subunit